MPAGLACSRYSMLSRTASRRRAIGGSGQVVRVEIGNNSQDTALDEGGERIIDHRLVVNRLELFARHERQRYNREPAPPRELCFHPTA